MDVMDAGKKERGGSDARRRKADKVEAKRGEAQCSCCSKARTWMDCACSTKVKHLH